MRAALLYLVLVGGPFAGLLLVLAAGRGVAAPAHVGGAWLVQRGGAAQWAPGCLLAGAEARSSIEEQLVIHQSGRYAQGEWPALRTEQFRVEIDGDRVAGHIVLRPDESCRGGSASFTATLVQLQDGQVLRGTLERGACATCAPVSFELRRRHTPRAAR